MVANGIIHRDLKPANILKHEGVVKITGFIVYFLYIYNRGDIYLIGENILSPIEQSHQRAYFGGSV